MRHVLPFLFGLWQIFQIPRKEESGQLLRSENSEGAFEPMRISFDLDDTLICDPDEIPCEPRPFWYRRLLAPREPLRLGTCSLFRDLRDRGWEIWIYTTSYRSPRSIRKWLRAYGLHAERVINQNDHERFMRSLQVPNPPSKNPGAFGIDLHVDDSEGVQMEGERCGFAVVVVARDDLNWTDRVLQAAGGIRAK